MNEVDYKRINERGICSVGINNAAAYAPVRAMVSGDPPEKFHWGTFFDPGIIKFLPKQYLAKRIRARCDEGFRFTSFRACDCPQVYGITRTAQFDPERFFDTKFASWGVNTDCHERTGLPKCIFTFFIAFRVLHYLGVRRVYMIGVDFAMANPGMGIGSYAFQQKGGAGGNNDHYRAAVKLMGLLSPVFDSAGFAVYQTNPNSRLTCFPLVKFEAALEDCRNPVPHEPFDLRDWYTKKGNWKPDE